jgi:hypothetical protein
VANSFAPLVYEYEFRIPVDLAYIVRAIMTLEGISLQLDPGFDIFSVSAPYAARMMLTYPNPSLRQRLLAELVTADGSLDWAKLKQLAELATTDNGFRLETEGLAGPALEMVLSPEGAALRHALVAELVRAPGDSAGHVQDLAPLLASDPSFSGRAILERLVAYVLSPAGAETREQLIAGLQTRENGCVRFDLGRATQLASLASRLHPDFRLGTLLQALGGYALSEEGWPVVSQALAAGTLRLLGGLGDRLGRLARPAPAAAPMAAMPAPAK